MCGLQRGSRVHCHRVEAVLRPSEQEGCEGYPWSGEGVVAVDRNEAKNVSAEIDCNK